jgi:hypothetical protein
MTRSFRGRCRLRDYAWCLWVGAAWATVGGCSSSDSFEDGSSGNGSDSWGKGGSASVSSGTTNASFGGAASSSVPAEKETNVDFEAPQSSLRYVYATNPDRDSVAVIDASTLAIQVVNTGDQPRYLRTIPGRDAALLVDVGAGDLAFLETTDGKSTVAYLRNLPSANAIEVAPDGRHAVAYFDVTRMQQGKFETLQDVSVVSLTNGAPVATRMTVGFKPRKVTFAGGTSGAAAAYVVTDDGVSVLDFAKIDAAGKSSIADTIPIFDAAEQKGADISVTPDGKYAVGRVEGTSTLRLVELSSATARVLDVAALLPASVAAGGSSNAAGGSSNAAGGSSNAAGGSSNAAGGTGDAAGSAGIGGTARSAVGGVGNGSLGSRSVDAGGSTGSAEAEQADSPDITDLALAPDGTFALAVSRNRGVWLRIPIPEGFSEPSLVTEQSVPNVVVGSAAVSPNGHWAVLFTNAITTERRVVIVDLTNTLAPRVLDLTKSIKGVAFSSSGEQAYVLHNKAAGDPNESGITAEAVLERSYGYTLIDLAKAFRKLMVTQSDPNLSVTTPKAPYAFLTFQGESTTVQRLDMDSLQVSSIVLGSVPSSLGVVSAAQRVFVNQKYSEGRLTFIDWSTLEMKTVTGYELNSKIRE